MPYTRIASTIASTSDTTDATHAVTRSTPSITKSNSSGSAAISELHARECATGSRICWYGDHLAGTAGHTTTGV
jgi:hypothetical protein